MVYHYMPRPSQFQVVGCGSKVTVVDRYLPFLASSALPRRFLPRCRTLGQASNHTTLEDIEQKPPRR
jgi:hypothetical protein